MKRSKFEKIFQSFQIYIRNKILTGRRYLENYPIISHFFDFFQTTESYFGKSKIFMNRNSIVKNTESKFF
jgi:hypothetical protein